MKMMLLKAGFAGVLLAGLVLTSKASVTVTETAWDAVDGPGDIAKINSLKSEAKKAYLAGDFKTAILKYKYLVDSLGVSEEEVQMNLSNAYFRANDTTNAATRYQPLTASKDTRIKSVANQQLGVLANRQGKAEEALSYFKEALKTAPDNDAARYNYEMIKKKLEEKKKQDQKDKDKKDKKDNKDQDKKDQNKDQKDKKDQNKDQKDKKDQDKKDQEKKEQDQKEKDQKDNKDQKDQKDKKDQKSKEEKDKEEKEKKEKQEKEKQNKDDKSKDKKDIPPSVSEKLKDMQMSEQKARMILEAMKNQEVQYLQQNKRKATKPKETNKPDW